MKMNQTFYKVVVTIDNILGIVKETGLWAKDIEDAKDKAYFKWLNADKIEVFEQN